MFQLKDTQQIDLALGPVVDKRGNPTTVQNPTWTSSDTSVVTVTASGDGMACVAAAAGPLGTATVTLDADGDLGDGVSPLTSAPFDIEVIAGDAVAINIVPGVPTEQP